MATTTLTSYGVNEKYIAAFYDLLRKAVNTTFREEFTILYDEQFFKYLPSFIQLANDNLMKVTYIFLPDSYQQVIQKNDNYYHNKEIWLPAGTREAVNKSNIVINFLTGSTQSSKVRGAVLNYIHDDGGRILHCPNLSDEVLDIIQISNFDAVHKDCELVAWALGNTKNATLISTDAEGSEYKLSIPIDSWSNEPFISSGIIAENSWGNILPGEAFWCPYSSKNVNGQVCINGSAPNYRFYDGGDLVITFENGRATQFIATANSQASIYLDKLLKEVPLLKDVGCWDKFAELGIGLNPDITYLTGNSLFDEKMVGTVHIAIGDNGIFDHDIQSQIHHDLVILNPTLILDDIVIINKGKLNKEQIQTKRNNFRPPALSFLENSKFEFNTSKIGISHSKIERLLNKGKRLSYINLNLDIPESFILQFANYLKEKDGFDVYFSDMSKKFKKSIQEDRLKEMLETFVHYKMATIINYHENGSSINSISSCY